MLKLFPDSTRFEPGAVLIGGVRADQLVREFGTPLFVLDEETMRRRAREYQEAAPGSQVVYASKALPSVALMRLFAEEGLGADVSTLGELEFALRAGVPGERIVMHGNNKSDEELRAAAVAKAGYVVLDALDEVERAAAAGVQRVLIRVTPGIDADTHDSIRTGHHGSKFGLPPQQAVDAVRRARAAGLEVAGLHAHIGSQLLELGAARLVVDAIAGFAAECRADLGWEPEIVNLGGGQGIAYVEEDHAPSATEFVRTLVSRVERAWSLYRLAPPRLILEPGRALVGRAGVALYTVGVVKRASETTTYVAIDGGMSDNPRPQLYGARYSALVANRPQQEPDGWYTVCGKHCESGDVLIERVQLPAPRRGDILAVPASGAYTLAMASNYNAMPRPAAVLVRDGEARLIRRRETIDDLLALEVEI